MAQAFTFQIANELFIKQGRTDIQLCEDGYNGWCKKSKFFDLIVKEYFLAIPRNVYWTKSSPKRKTENTKNTLIKKHGVENISQIKEVKEKKKQIFLKKYGVETNLQAPEILKKIKKGWAKKFGTEYPITNSDVKKKIINKNIERYGVENPFSSAEIKQKIVQTNIKKYGFEHPMHVGCLKIKQRNTLKKNYGVEYVLQIPSIKNKLLKLCSKRFIIESGDHLKKWLDKQPEPKPAYKTFCDNFPNENISLKELEDFCKNYKDHKTTLEVLGEKLFNTTHYNKKPKEIQKYYRPDFKLSETVYVNVDGLYWHSEKQVSKNYHFEMRKHFEKNGLRLFQFYENEIKYKAHICKFLVDNVLGQFSNKIHAENCIINIVNVTEAQIFLNKNHLFGQVNAKHVGLYYENKLISILSYKETRNICKIERFCNLIGYYIEGAFNKLTKHVEYNLLKPSTNEMYVKIDLRYDTAVHVESSDFKLIKETVGFLWTNCETTFDKNPRNAIVQEHENMTSCIKLYDAGQKLYIKKLYKIYVNNKKSIRYC